MRTGTSGRSTRPTRPTRARLVQFQISIINSGNAAATNVPVSDNISALLARATYNNDCSDSCTFSSPTLSWTIPSIAAGATETITFSVTLSATFPVGVTNLPNLVVVTGPGSNCPAGSTDPACDTITTVSVASLPIDKSFTGNTGGTGPGGIAEAREGDTLTYTLAYDLTNGPVTSGVITDVLPAGLEYVAGSATGNAQFTFTSYNSATRTLTWNAPTVSVDGSVTYRVVVAAGAAALPQPLVNTAVIDSAETAPDDDTDRVLIEVPPLAATATPRITLPPTSTIDGSEQPATPGNSLMLVLLALGAFVLAVGFITPVPARVRRRDRR